MLKRLSLLAVALLISATASHTVLAQDITTGDDVIKAHIEATGGEAAWNAVKDMYAEIEIVAATPMGNLTIELKTWSIFPGYGFTEMGLLDGPDGIPAEAVAMKAYYTPLEGWIEQGGQRQDIKDLPPAAQQQFMRTAPKSELALLTEKVELTLKSDTTFEDRAMYVVGSNQYGIDSDYWVDKETLMIVAQSAAGATTTISNYQEIDGLIFSMGQTAQTPQGTQTVSVKKVELNSGLTPAQLARKSGTQRQAMPE